MSMEKLTEIERFAIDLQDVSRKVTNILLDETKEFLGKNRKYKNLADFHKAHPKGRKDLEAEFLMELGYRKASEVVGKIVGEILFYMDTHKEFDGADFGRFLAELEKKYTEGGE